MPRVYTYRIDEKHLPKGAKSCIEWAMTQWMKASNGRVRFTFSYGSPDIMFAGGEPPEKPAVAWWFDLGNGVHSIIFDPATSWATTWWHRTFTDRADLRTLALHEIGHVLLGPEHSNDPESIMYFRPERAEIHSASRTKVRLK